MTIASTTSAVKGGVAKRLAALAVAAATLLAGGAFAVTAAPSALADDAETNVALNTEKGNDNAPDVQVSYVTGWNSTAAINDGSLDGNASYGGWGTWGNTSTSETATYTWNRAVTTSKSVGYYWTNVKTGDGGVPLPKDVSIEYLNADSGQYETVSNLQVDKAFPTDDELDATNPVYGPYTYTFDQVTTKSMKLVVNKKANDNKGITVTEWQVFGTSAALPVDPGDPGAFLNVQQVAVRTTPGVDPTPKLPAEVWATPQDGPSIKVPVTWETVPADAYATAGDTAEVKGTTAAGTYDNIKVAAGQATATIGVYDQLNTEVTDAEYVSTITAPGIKPVLQDTVALTYADGSVESGHKVTWDSIPAADYAEAEQVGEVSGTIEGTDIKASGTFFVVAPSDPEAKPIVAINFDSAAPGSGWYTTAPKFTITAQRGVSTVPITTIEYKIGDGAWTSGKGPISVTTQGSVAISARATDENGNSREVSQTIKVDTAAPVVTAKQESKNGNDVVVSLTADDGAAGSDVTRVLYSTGPSSNPKSNENTMWGTYTDEDKVKVQLSADHDTYVHFYAQDAAGNESDYANINLGKGEAVTPTPTPSVDSVAVSGDGVKDGKLALTAGDTAQLTAEVKVTDDAAKTVTWKSSDEQVATVDKDGKVTAVAEGTATITATSTVDDSKSASVEVAVSAKEQPTVPVDSVEIAGDGVADGALSLEENASAKLTAAVKPENATDKTVTWESSDDNIATVSADGTVTAVKAGEATITATAANGKSDTVKVTVTAAPEPAPGATEEERKPLNDKIAAIEGEKLDAKQYTADSWKALEDALTNAKAVVADQNATAAQVTAALNKLDAARSGLVKASTEQPTKPGTETGKDNNKGDQNKDAGKTGTALSETGSAVTAVAVATVLLAGAGAALQLRKRCA